jgi:Tripartite tricarboxylate transporter TctB family
MSADRDESLSVEGYDLIPPPDRQHLITRLAFEAVIFVVLAAAVYGAADFLDRARWFPQYMAIGGLLLVTTQIILDVVALQRMRRSEGSVTSGPAPAESLGGGDVTADGPASDLRHGVALNPTIRVAAWLAGYVALVAIVGLPVASPVFVHAYSHFEARMNWRHTAAIVVFTIVVIWFFVSEGHLRLPPSLLL